MLVVRVMATCSASRVSLDPAFEANDEKYDNIKNQLSLDQKRISQKFEE